MRDFSQVDFWIWVLLALSIVPGIIAAAWFAWTTRNVKPADETDEDARRAWQANSL